MAIMWFDSPRPPDLGLRRPSLSSPAICCIGPGPIYVYYELSPLFPEKIGNDVKIIDVLALIEDEEKFFKASDEDAIQLCLLLSLE
ncbi:hypothetical protein Tco_1519064, partial [Tanacetum coccineum]